MTAYERVNFTSRASMADIALSTATVARSSGWSVSLGTAMLVIPIVSVFLGLDIWLALPLGLLGLSLVTGFLTIPFVWMAVRRNPELQLAPTEVRANAEGIALDSPGSASRSAWSTFRRASETSRAFLLDTGTGLVIIIAKRGVAAPDVAAFRALLNRTGLLEIVPTWRRLLKAGVPIVFGLAISGGLVIAPIALTYLQANARIDLSVTVVDDIVTVVGSTDLPDGALIAVDVYQADEWRRRGTDGRPPDIETFPWIDGHDVRVDDGAFDATIDVGGWPPGNGGAMAFFWVDGTQPDAVLERFGDDGALLRGPRVDEFDDGTPRLRVHASFDIP